MKPIVNYGLSDSLIDAVRKSVEEGKGDGNLANNARPYNKITRGDVIAGRLGKDKKGGKTTINTNPKLKEEEYEQMDEISSELAGRASNARIDRNMSGGTSHTDIRKLKKGSMTPLDQQRKTTAGYMKTLDRKNEEVEQIEERNKQNAMMRKTMDASRGARFKLNNPVPDAEPEHKTARAQNVAIGRALRKEEDEREYVKETDEEKRDTHVVTLTRGTTVGARSHRMFDVHAASEEEAIKKAKAEHKKLMPDDNHKQFYVSRVHEYPKMNEEEQMDEAFPDASGREVLGYDEYKARMKKLSDRQLQRDKKKNPDTGKRGPTGSITHYVVDKKGKIKITREEEEQMDEGRIDDLMDKRRAAARLLPAAKSIQGNVTKNQGKRYGGSAQPPDPEEDDEDPKGPRTDKGLTRKRRFNTKSYTKLRSQYK